MASQKMGKFIPQTCFQRVTMWLFLFSVKMIFFVMKFRYDDLSTRKLFKVDKNTLESLGTLVAMKDGCFVFGKPGKLLKIRVD